MVRARFVVGDFFVVVDFNPGPGASTFDADGKQTQVFTIFDGTASTVDIQNAPSTINLTAYTLTIEFSEEVTGFEEEENSSCEWGNEQFR